MHTAALQAIVARSTDPAAVQLAKAALASEVGEGTEIAALCERLRGLMAKATPGPWKQVGPFADADKAVGINGSGPSVFRAFPARNIWREDYDNAALITEGVNALPVLLDHIAALSAGGWRTIESAPKDGTRFLGLYRSRYASESRMEVVWWQPEFEAFISGCREMQMHNGYSFADGSTRQLHSPEILPATHWLCAVPDLPALPAPPAKENDDGLG